VHSSFILGMLSQFALPLLMWQVSGDTPVLSGDFLVMSPSVSLKHASIN